MKSKIILSFLCVIFLTTSIFAQTAANMTTANIDMHYTISSKANTAEPIVIDVSIIPFKTTEVAKNYFPAICDNNLTYTYDGSRYVSLTLNHYEGTPTRTVAEWNTYISNLFDHAATVLASMNK